MVDIILNGSLLDRLNSINSFFDLLDRLNDLSSCFIGSRFSFILWLNFSSSNNFICSFRLASRYSFSSYLSCFINDISFFHLLRGDFFNRLDFRNRNLRNRNLRNRNLRNRDIRNRDLSISNLINSNLVNSYFFHGFNLGNGINFFNGNLISRFNFGDCLNRSSRFNLGWCGIS